MFVFMTTLHKEVYVDFQSFFLRLTETEDELIKSLLKAFPKTPRLL